MATITMSRRRSPGAIRKRADALIADAANDNAWRLDWELEGLQADAGCLSVCGDRAKTREYMAVCLHIRDERARLTAAARKG